MSSSGFRIGDRDIRSNAPCYIIAEAGTAHGGSLDRAVELVDAAADAGADCVKFQAVLADEIVHPHTGNIELPGGSVSIHAAFRRVETDARFFARLADRCRARSIHFLCTPFGIGTARMLRDLAVEAVKIASPEINHYPLLSECASYRIPCILSTGVSTLGDIEAALGLFSGPVALLHCVTAYPAPPEEYNLRVIEHLSSLFGVPVGVSDHSLDPTLVPVLATLMGAALIEKHLTLSRQGGGLDDPVALPPAEFASLVVAVREAEDDPERTRATLRRRFGEEMLESVLGDGHKRLARPEAAHYATTNRSIITTRVIESGEPFCEANLALLRSETNLTPGLHPRYFGEVLRRTAASDLPDGHGLRWEDIAGRCPTEG